MLNSFHPNNVVATSGSDSENELIRSSRQLPSQLAAQLPTFALEKSSDIQIGPRQQNNEQVTVNEYEYIRVTGENDESLDQYPYDDIYTTTPQTPESGQPVDVALKHQSGDVMTFQKQAWLRNPYVWSLFVFVLVAAIIITLILSMSKDESNSAPPNNVSVTDKILLEFENENVDVYEGHRSVEWVVNVTASSQPKLVWYGPNYKVLEERNGPIRLEEYTSKTRTVTKLKLYNISVADRGVYRLQASNEEGEEWAYFTLNVIDNVSVTDKILLEFENENVDVYEGHSSVEWVVNVTASSQPKLVWYGPNYKVLEERNGPIRLEEYTSKTRTVTKLKLYNISVADRGVYRLQASNEEGEECANFTLNVIDNVSVTDKILLEFENENVDVYEGHSSVEWVVNVTASSQPKLVWYGPNYKVLEERNGPIRLEEYTSKTRTVTKLKLYNISVADRGVYRLQASNEEGEEWAYFTLNVTDSAYRRPGLGKFTVDNIDPTLCTHLVYAHAVLDMTTNAIESRDPAYDLEENNGSGAYRKMTSLKRGYPHLKVLLSMGGWETSGKKNYSEMAESPSRRMALVSSVSEFLRKYNFDGLDLHWRYPATGKGVPADKENFVSLLKEFREEFDKFGLLLMAPLGVHPYMIEHSYDIPAVSQYLHYMFAESYSYYTHRNELTGPNAPLYPCCGDDNLNVESSINTLLRKGADPNKLLLGLDLFGQIFKLKNPDAGVGFEKESEGAGMQGPYQWNNGAWGYNEICLVVDNATNYWTKYWDNVTHTPYASKGDQFITYDNAMSLKDKVELAVRKKLAGVAVRHLDIDDFNGSCNFGSSGSTGYPLMRAINNALDNSVSWKKIPCTSRSSATGPVH